MVHETPDKISVAIPRMPDADALLPYLRRIDAARYYSNFGPLVEEFEVRIAGGFKLTPACVTTVASATVALTLALRVAAPPPGAFCMMPSWTFSASAHAAREAGLRPFFVDVAHESWALTPEIARAALAGAPGRVAAVLPVAPFGAPIDYDRWDRFAEDTGIPVVIDAAAAFDTARPGRAPVAISLHATKALGVGEGGLLLSRDEELIAKVRSLSNFGFQHGRSAILPGLNAKLSEYAAAVGLAALDAWPFVRTGYVRLARTYAAALSAVPGLSVMPGFGREWAGTTCNVEFVRPVLADVARDLTGAGIENRQWWGQGCHQQSAFADYPCAPLEVTHHLARHTLALPFHLGLGPVELRRIITVLADSLAAAGAEAFDDSAAAQAG
jgi:dTDP-4-amino-4,6-dideoxygalactose transaminase